MNFWGYDDVKFTVDAEDTVVLSGMQHTYEITGKPIKKLIPFVKSMLGTAKLDRVAPSDLTAVLARIIKDKETRRSLWQPFTKQCETLGVALSREAGDLLSHSHGQLSVDEIYKMFYETPEGELPFNIVDLVVYPTSTKQIQQVYDLAVEFGAKLIPYGGGTNVTGCLLHEATESLVVSMDMRQYNKLVKIDRENNWAIFQSGINGHDLEDVLAKFGFTSGHEPDSYEFSTLGGWCATKASGMKRGKYGNIEDIVIGYNMVTSLPETSSYLDTTPKVRSSEGPQLQYLHFGSEGNHGIFTEICIKIHKLPQVKKYQSFVFPQMPNALQFLKEVEETGLTPASLRVVDNNQFRFGQALKPEKSWFKHVLDMIVKFFLFYILRFDLYSMVAATVVMEGSKEVVKQQNSGLTALAKRHGGVVGGSENGRAGYNLTHAIAYIRDFFNQYQIIAETFETSVQWSNILLMTSKINDRMEALAKERGMKYFISYRVTQIYKTGVCVYYTLALYKASTATYKEIEHELRLVMRQYGGSISHHHGVGKSKASELPKSLCAQALKNVYDRSLALCQNNFLVETPINAGKLAD